MIKIKAICHTDPDYDKIVNEGNMYINSNWYLHGKVEDVFHYDVCTIYDAPKEVTIPYKSEKTICFDGICEVEVHGVDKRCIGYFWTVLDRDKESPSGPIIQRGLVCLEDDMEARHDALAKMKKHAIFI